MVFYVSLTLVVFVVTLVIYHRYFRGSRFLRGSRLQQNPVSVFKMKVPSISDGLSFGGFPLNFRDARQHFLLVGATGSGKTCLIRLLLQSVCHRMAQKKENIRVMVYDSKTDLVSKIAGMDGVSHDQIKILNPLDARCSAWDMATDLSTTYYAHEFVETLIPYDKNKGGENSHFFITSQIFILGIIEALNHHAPAKWELRDIINVSLTTERLKALFLSCPKTAPLVDQHFSVAKTAHSVKATMHSYLRSYEPIAEAWHHAAREREPVSIRGWLEGSGQILVLGNNPKAKAALMAVNRLLFAEASKGIRAIPGEAQGEQSWIFLDELSELGKLPSLKDLLITGRSKGAAVVMGFQDILGIDAEYGKEASRELVGQPQNVAFLHLNPVASETQKWASECVGKWEFKRDEYGSSISPGGVSNSTQERHHIQDIMLPSQFESDLPKAGSETGLTALFRIRKGQIAKGFPKLKSGWFMQHFPPEIIFGEKGDLSRLRGSDPEFPDFVERDESHSELTDWNADDFERLGPALWKVANPSRTSAAPDPNEDDRKDDDPHPKL